MIVFLFLQASIGFVNLYIVPVIVSVSILFYSILFCSILFDSVLFSSTQALFKTYFTREGHIFPTISLTANGLKRIRGE